MQLLLLCWVLEDGRAQRADVRSKCGWSRWFCAECGAEIPACHLKYKLENDSWGPLAQVSWGHDTVFL